jgi:hypothetical protein
MRHRWAASSKNSKTYLILALLTATAYEDEFADALTDKDSPFAAMHELIEEGMAAAAEARGYTGLDLRLTVRVPFVALLSAAIFGAPVFSSTGRRSARDRIFDEIVAFAVYGTTGRNSSEDSILWPLGRADATAIVREHQNWIAVETDERLKP